MSTIFPKWVNRLPLILVFLGGSAAFGAVGFVWYYFSPEYTDVGYAPRQPVPYSHRLHAGQLGMDCRYCHTGVETSSFANIPPSQTCMNCHTAIKPESPLLQPVRDSFAANKPVEWVNVHLLPDYAHFPHDVHVAAGVGCASCHGRIDQMDVVRQVKPLSMAWCLECHRNPAQHIRPPDQVTNMKWEETHSLQQRTELGQRLLTERNIQPPTNCSACHY